MNLLFTLDDNIGAASLIIENYGDLPIKPEIFIKKTEEEGSVVLTNVDTQEEFGLDFISLGETVYINNENFDILSDLPETFHYDNLIESNFLELKVGTNEFTVEGNSEIIIRMKDKLQQG